MGSIVHASINENNSTTGGKAGDQTGKEVCVRTWYSKGWSCMLRCSDSSKAQKAAAIAVKLANSNLVGYSQSNRNSLYAELKKNKWDVDEYIKSKKKTECDCSSFIFACYCCVIPKLRSDGNAPTTSTIPTTFKPHGFSINRESKYLTTDKNLQIGDIIDKESGHVAMYISSEKSLNMTDTSPSSDSSGGVSSSEFDRKDSLFREVGYLSSKIEPSIKSSDIRLSLVNTSAFYIMTGGDSSTSSTSNSSYNIDKLTSKQKSVIDFLTGKGLNLAGSVGILANIEHESPGVNTAAIGDNGTSFGICQWHNERGTAMKKYVGSNWKTNLTGQLNYLWSELTSSYKSVLESIQTVQDTLAGCKSAADVFVRKFEVPANVDSESKKRQATAETIWKKCSITVTDTSTSTTSTSTSDTVKKLGEPTKSVTIPSSVKQTGIIANYTNYSYWLSKWKYNQKKVADLWSKQGKQQDRQIATISGYYLVAVSSIFGTVGDIIKVNLSNNKSFSCIIADIKGSDAESTYGHLLNGKVDIIEWEMKGKSSSAVDSATQQKMDLSGWKGKHVKSIENYGQYWGL